MVNYTRNKKEINRVNPVYTSKIGVLSMVVRMGVGIYRSCMPFVETFVHI